MGAAEVEDARVVLGAAMLGCLFAAAHGDMYDLIADWKLPPGDCLHGCDGWANHNHSWWANASNAAAAGNACAQLAYAPGLRNPTGPTGYLDPTGQGGNGAWCFCANATAPPVPPELRACAAAVQQDCGGHLRNLAECRNCKASVPGAWAKLQLACGARPINNFHASCDALFPEPAFGYCTSPAGTVSQINLQIAGPKTVVVSFVTFEAAVPTDAPVALAGVSPAMMTASTGAAVTHVYKTPSGNRTYLMHFVVLADLAPRTRYFYRVKSGGAGAHFSAVHSFRSGYSSSDGPAGSPTKVAIFGDMGVYSWNNMANLKADVEVGAIDLVVQMGDHCYNLGGDDDRRGDGYMEAYAPVLSAVPWLPIVGNHEFLDGDELRRYLNQTEGNVVARPAGHPLVAGASTTADTALGRLLATGNHHGAGVSGSVPSGTSRFYSVDFGLVHFVALDLNMYNGVDTCGAPCRAAQLKWLRADLAAVDRAATPWIVAMSHFPLYCSNCPAPGQDPHAPWYNSEQCEFEGHDPSCKPDTAPPPPPPGFPTNADMVPDLEPIFMEFGVDVYSSGHIHDYEFIYPTFNNTAVQTNFVNPRAPVHLVSGNAGPPSASKFTTIQPWSHEHSTVYSYTRLVVYNASTMKWIQVANNDSRVLTELVVTQERHGRFPIPRK